MRKTYRFNHGIAQGGFMYAHVVKEGNIRNREGLRLKLKEVETTLGLLDVTIKIYGEIFFFFFTICPVFWATCVYKPLRKRYFWGLIMPKAESEKPRFCNARKIRLPKYCVCPDCGVKQPFKKTAYFKRVKDLSLGKERTILLQVVTAKCKNPNCKRTAFALSNRFADKFSRSTRRRKETAVSVLVEDNTSCERTARRLSSSFNAGCGKSTVDRWKHETAKSCSFSEIIPMLGFSGVLGLDELKPMRSNKYAYMASDVKTGRILYVQHVKRRDFKNTRDFLLTLKSFGLNPHALVIDMWKGFAEAVSCVFPNAVVQYDFFHVMKEVHRTLYAAFTKYRRAIKKSRKRKHLHPFLWKNRFKIFTGDGKLTRKDRHAIRRLLKEHEGTIIGEIVEFRKDVRKIFDGKTYAMAVKRRDALRAKYHKACFRKAIRFLRSKKFEFMTTFLKHTEIPRAGNSETMIRTFRQMEKARYGFKTESGLQDHVKLFQLKNYLRDEK